MVLLPVPHVADGLVGEMLEGATTNVVDLVNRLEAEIKAGRQGCIADGLTRIHLVILDEQAPQNHMKKPTMTTESIARANIKPTSKSP
jgi:hypothetical protein